MWSYDERMYLRYLGYGSQIYGLKTKVTMVMFSLITITPIVLFFWLSNSWYFIALKVITAVYGAGCLWSIMFIDGKEWFGSARAYFVQNAILVLILFVSESTWVRISLLVWIVISTIFAYESICMHRMALLLDDAKDDMEQVLLAEEEEFYKDKDS